MRHLFILILLSLTVSVKAVEPLVLSPNQKGWQMEGWGVSLCWWANMCGHLDEKSIDTLVDWLVSPDGLNYNIFRYNIGGGDDPQNRNCELHHMWKGKGKRAEMPGFKLYSDSLYDWAADSAQIKIMLKIKEHRPDAIFEAFSNSAPWWMTISGCCGGNAIATDDNLREDSYDAFADYLIDVCQYMKDEYGIEFRTLEPFNEPLSDYWPQNGSQEGCHFSVAAQKKMVDILDRKLRSSRLSTVISASDETCTEHSLQAFDGYGETLKKVGQWNVHTYSATNEQRTALHERCEKNGIRLWMSESGSGGKGLEGNLLMLKRLFDDVHYLQPAAWIDWQYVEERTDQWNLVQADYSKKTLWKIKNFFVRQQVTRFIGQNYKILFTGDDDSLCALSPDGRRLVIVCLNITEKEQQRSFDLSAFNARNQTVEIYTTSADEDLRPSLATIDDDAILNVSLASKSVKTIIQRVY